MPAPFGNLRRSLGARNGDDARRARFSSFVEAAPLPMAVIDPEGRYVASNAPYRDLLGYTEEELAAIEFPGLIAPNDVSISQTLFAELQAGTRAAYSLERYLIHRNGGAIPVRSDAYTADGLQVEVVTDLRERLQAARSARDIELRLELQDAVIRGLARAESLDAAIAGFLATLGERGGWRAATFWNADGPEGTLRPSHRWHHADIHVLKTDVPQVLLARGEGLAGTVWETGTPVWLEDIEAVAGPGTVVSRYTRGGNEGLRAAFAFPIPFEGTVRGVVELVGHDTRPRDESLVTSLTALGALVGRFFGTEQAAQTLRASEERYRTITEIAHDAVMTIDESGTIVSVNGAAERVFGFARPDLVGRPLTLLIPENLREPHRAGLNRYLTNGRRRLKWEGLELPALHSSGKQILIELSLAEFMQDGRRVFTGYMRDITERKQEQSALTYQALHDSLTDLPNRSLIMDRIQQSILVANRHGNQNSLLLLDLDSFKEVNDTFGHHNGDLLLKQVAARLVSAVRDSDTVARLGGDEFAVLLPATDAGGAIATAERIRDALRHHFTIEGHDLDIGASIGIAHYPEHGKDATMLMRRADVAMYAAKRSGRDYSVYSPDRDERSSLRLLLTRELRQAIDEDQLLLQYQPKVSLRDDTIHNVEALVRWHHPERGPTSPDQFIPLAEETGLIKPLTIWVLNEALRQHVAWREAGLDVRVAVNFSARTLHDPELLTTVTRLLDLWETDASRLEIEITESAIMLDPERALKTLTDLHDAGIWTSIDDFGTGYSSLGYLRRLPVDEIKIDKSFVIEMATNRDDASIVRSVVALGHNLGLQVVAEGVENRRTLAMLTEMQCDLAQGFYLSRPLSAAAVTEWLTEPKPRLSIVS